MVKLRAPEAAAPEVQAEAVRAAPFADRVPSNWEVREAPGGISARNNVSGETFEGSVAEFNRRMRG